MASAVTLLTYPAGNSTMADVRATPALHDATEGRVVTPFLLLL